MTLLTADLVATMCRACVAFERQSRLIGFFCRLAPASDICQVRVGNFYGRLNGGPQHPGRWIADKWRILK